MCKEHAPSGAYSLLLIFFSKLPGSFVKISKIMLLLFLISTYVNLLCVARSFGFHISFSANYDITLVLPQLFLTFFQNPYNKQNTHSVPTPALLLNVL